MAVKALKTKMKHINCCQYWVRCLRDRNICIPAHADIKQNLSDLFTKILYTATFEGLRDHLSHLLKPYIIN